MNIRRCRRLLLAVLTAFLAVLGDAGPTDAQPKPGPLQPNPQAPVLKTIGPCGVRRGTTVEITLLGTNLAAPVALWTGFPAKVSFPADGNNGKDPAKLVVRLEVPKDAPIGTHGVRLMTGKGMSNLRLFCVDDLPQVMAAGNQRSIQTAQELTPPCVVVGKATAEAGDYYKVKVAAGQRLSFEVIGRRLGSAFDPELTLYDVKTGRELRGGHSNDAPGLQTDPRLTYTFKEAGEVAVQVRDVLWRGGDDFHYRLRIGDFPCATSPLPLAARRGAKVKVAFAGPTVEGIAPVEVDVPNDPNLDSVNVTPVGPNGLPGWPVTLALSDLDEQMEQEPNDEPAQANRIPVPGAITGRFLAKNDRDHYVFTAKKGQRYMIDAHAQEWGSPTEVLLTLLDAKGGQVAVSNPMAAPRIDFTAPADGDFILRVEHLLLWGGPDEAYRVTVLPYEPGFDLSIGLDRFDVQPGGSLSLPLVCVRRDYAGPIEVSVAGPKGLSGQVTIEAGKASPQPNAPVATLVVKADADLPGGPVTFRVVGKANINGRMVTHPASVRQAVSQSLAGLPLPPRPFHHDLALAVLAKPPFSLVARFDAPETMPGKPVMLTVTVARAAGFNGEVILSAAGLPPNVTAMLVNIPAGQNEIKVPVNPAANAAPGSFPITISGKAQHQGREYQINAPPVPLVLKK
jgi:hypothetical protein